MNGSKIFFLALALVCWSCSGGRKLSKKPENTLQQLIELSPVFAKNFTGFVLYDPGEQQSIYEKNAGKYFTPASNTKIFTLYSALKVLGDSLPVLRYAVWNDTLVFQGLGNPLLLHPDFEMNAAGFDLLKKWEGPLFYSGANYRDERFGPGWAWDDYPYYYQAEKTALPIYGNVVRVGRKKARPGFEIAPHFFDFFFTLDYHLPANRVIFRRPELDNHFTYSQAAAIGPAFERNIPVHNSPALLTALLSDTLQRPVEIWRGPLQKVNWKTISMPTPDTLYQRLMKNSDNFIAEQLLLMCSGKIHGALKTDEAIKHAREKLCQNFPDSLVWKDGSGLSRYNLFTPRTIVALLEQLYREYPQDRLFSIFAAGGASGTIRSWYGGNQDGPFIFAKTGTLANNHCLSGYLLAKSGKVLIFSFMHNHYTSSSSVVKKEMEKVLNWVREEY